MRIDPKAPADSPHHPRNVAFAGLQERLDTLARQALTEAGIELPPGVAVTVDLTPIVDTPKSFAVPEDQQQKLVELCTDGDPEMVAMLTGEPAEVVHHDFVDPKLGRIVGVSLPGAGVLDLEPLPEPDPELTAALAARLAEAGLTEEPEPPKRPRKPAARKTAASGTATQAKQPAKPRAPRKPKADLDAALARLEGK